MWDLASGQLGIRLQIINSEGLTVDRIEISDNFTRSVDGQLNELLEGARRAALGLDEVIMAMLEELDK